MGTVTVAANSLACFVRLSLVALVAGANVTESEQGRQKAGNAESESLAQLTITDADTLSNIDLLRVLEESSRTGDTSSYRSIASKVQLDVEPVAGIGVLSLSLQRVPPLISDDFEATGDQSTRNILMYCFYSGYVLGDEARAREQTNAYAHAQLCPELLVRVSLHRDVRANVDAAGAQENVSRIRLTQLSRNGVKVELDYSSLPKMTQHGDLVADSDRFVRVSELTQLSETPDGNALAEGQAQLESRMRRLFELDAQKIHRRRREVGKNSFLQQLDMDTSRFIELYAIVDSSAYALMRKDGASDIEGVKRRVGEYVSLSNAIMSGLNMWIVLVGIEVWTTPSMHRFTYNYTETLVNGERAIGGGTILSTGKYRVDQLLLKSNLIVDHVHLFTGEWLLDGAFGVSLLDSSCFWKSATITTLKEFYPNINGTYDLNPEPMATVIAHEIGHTLGAEHDNEPKEEQYEQYDYELEQQNQTSLTENTTLLESQTTQSCECDVPNNNCVMMPYVTMSPFPPRWSSCSKQRLLKPRPSYPMDICLQNKPRFARYYDEPLTCGDFVVDSSVGEQCDCGPNYVCQQTAAANCCDPQTCRFRNSTFLCANGPCCNISTCSYANAKTSCRSAINNCDLAEVCSGSSAECVRNAYKADGTECKDEMEQEGYCHGGVCRTVGHQCRALLGPPATQPNSDRNNEELCSRYAHCRSLNNDQNLNPDLYSRCLQPNYTSNGCSKLACEVPIKYLTAIKNIIRSLSLGIKSCYQLLEETGVQYPDEMLCLYFEGNINDTYRFMEPDFKFDARMVADGTKCGENKMCINQQCLSIETLNFSKCTPACKTDEICDNYGQCKTIVVVDSASNTNTTLTLTKRVTRFFASTATTKTKLRSTNTTTVHSTQTSASKVKSSTLVERLLNTTLTDILRVSTRTTTTTATLRSTRTVTVGTMRAKARNVNISTLIQSFSNLTNNHTEISGWLSSVREAAMNDVYTAIFLALVTVCVVAGVIYACS